MENVYKNSDIWDNVLYIKCLMWMHIKIGPVESENHILVKERDKKKDNS